MSIKRPLVLCVDDEPGISEMVREYLESAGYEAATANNGGLALELFDERRPDVVVLDQRMPGMSGVEVLAELRSRDADVAVVMLTAVDDLRTALGAVKHGAFDYMVKPAPMEEVLSSVQRALERRMLILQNRDYQMNLEKKVAEQTTHMEQRIRELKALNDLFRAHASRSEHIEIAHRQLIGGILKLAEDMRSLAMSADASHARPSAERTELSG